MSFQNQIRNQNYIEKKIVLKIENLKVWYPIKKGLLKRTIDHVKAINNLSFTLYEKETIGIVGESGSGKTSLILAILKLIESKGKIIINDTDLSKITSKNLKKIRKNLQIVFQDPFSSLSPRMTIEQIVSEGLKLPLDRRPTEGGTKWPPEG